ncbi:MAG: hypothetical protein H0W02_24755 [Ktedonobacteraceae bacterium]|nr:hypothetical protein [Ktedonobacteraceae bacterium]
MRVEDTGTQNDAPNGICAIVFIDDYPPHVSAARSCGMQGVIFETREQTIAELQALLGGALPGP